MLLNTWQAIEKNKYKFVELKNFITNYYNEHYNLDNIGIKQKTKKNEHRE